MTRRKRADVDGGLLAMSRVENGKHEDGAVRLNLRGKEFNVPVSVVDRYPESLLAVLCRETTGAVGGERAVTIDRDPELFKSILEIYRHSDDHVMLSSAPKGCSISDLEQELDFYQLPPLDDLQLVLHSDWYNRMGGLRTLMNNMLIALSRDRKACFMRDRAAFFVWVTRDALDSNFRNLQFETQFIGSPSKAAGQTTSYTQDLRSLVDPSLRSLSGLPPTSALRWKLGTYGGDLVLGCPNGEKILPRFRSNTLNMLAAELSQFGFGLKQYIFDLYEDRQCPVLVLEW